MITQTKRVIEKKKKKKEKQLPNWLEHY